MIRPRRLRRWQEQFDETVDLLAAVRIISLSDETTGTGRHALVVLTGSRFLLIGRTGYLPRLSPSRYNSSDNLIDIPRGDITGAAVENRTIVALRYIREEERILRIRPRGGDSGIVALLEQDLEGILLPR